MQDAGLTDISHSFCIGHDKPDNVKTVCHEQYVTYCLNELEARIITVKSN